MLSIEAAFALKMHFVQTIFLKTTKPTAISHLSRAAARSASWKDADFLSKFKSYLFSCLNTPTIERRQNAWRAEIEQYDVRIARRLRTNRRIREDF